jgi:hypothetical protein
VVDPNPLAIGAALIVLAAYRWSVGLAVWLAPVPFLLVLRRSARWRDRLVVLGVIVLATIAQVGKIITDPDPVGPGGAVRAAPRRCRRGWWSWPPTRSAAVAASWPASWASWP